MKKEEKEKEIVIARLESMPDDMSVSIGAEGKLSKEKLINHVKKSDKLGKQIINMQLRYLRSFKAQ